MTSTSSSQQAPLTVETRNGFHFKPRTMEIRENDLKFIMEQIVDFKSFEVNGYPLKEHFDIQGWMHFIDMLNDPPYPYLVKDFWVRAEVHDEIDASLEERGKIVIDEVKKGSQEQK